MLVEPFLTPVRPEQHAWSPDLDPRIAVVRHLAAEHGVTLAPADGLLAQAWLDAVGVR
ncbi:hypothetical protein [Cellulomonas timonensis]|uniref:hypothetical protein n=1 Tax=Cellulomonas timonensis TaxID=1689271 RepID=UPI001F2B825A|nr:hypothetical protein [Cellulomonas timonensis]